MKTQQSWITLTLVVAGIFIALLLIASVDTRTTESNGAGQSARSTKAATWNSPTPAVKPPGPYTYGARNLVGASPEQVGQFAVDYFVSANQVRSGTPQVLDTRPIKGDELPELDLGCPLESGVIEEPPLMLVVLRGDFDLNFAGSMTRNSPSGSSYVAAIFDVWSAQPTFITSSQDGTGFSKVLNNPALPVRGWGTTLVCPTPLPYPKVLHYGDTAPTIAPPTIPATPPAIPTLPPIPPPPVPTGD